MGSSINVDWNAIRSIGGSRRAGFEELCCQLADAERPEGTVFNRKGTPDAGIEGFVIFDDGREWGWQAKYFQTLGDSQWSQLNDSVRTALEKHSGLVRYYVCLPLDLPDARIEGRRSARDRWNDHVESWSEYARARGMHVEFVYWGSYQLIDRLSRPECRGRLRFWFDAHAFDSPWFEARLAEALDAAGPRYTQELRVDLPIGRKFEAFGRTKEFFDGLKSQARPLREKLGGFEFAAFRGESGRSVEQDGNAPSLSEDDLVAATAAVVEATNSILTALRDLEYSPTGVLPAGRIVDQIDAALVTTEALDHGLLGRERVRDERERKQGKRSSYENAYRERRYWLRELDRELRELHGLLLEADALASATLLILTGEAGTGKTHLLCDVTRSRVREGRPTVLLMGQRFLSDQDPWRQALHHLDLAELSAEEFVGALEAAAQAAGSRALVVVDALNEGNGRKIWPTHLAPFLTHIRRSAWIAVALAVRSSYADVVVPEDARTGAVTIEHEGFSEHEYDAARAFFDHYGIERPSVPLLEPEFRNPLFLKTLCRGLAHAGERRFPRGFHGISAVFGLFLDAVNSRLASELGFNPRRPLVRQAVEALTTVFVEARERWLPVNRGEDLVNALLPGRTFDQSLYAALVAEGVLIEEAVRESDRTEDVVQVAYDRLCDHLVAERLLALHLDAGSPEAAFGANGALAYLAKPEEYVPPGLIEALCVQVAERTHRELAELAPQFEETWGFGDAFRQSLIWRASDAFPEAAFDILDRVTKRDEDHDATVEVLVALATVPNHPLNAAFLHDRLSRDAMPDRDAWWSTYLHRAWGGRRGVDRLVEWAWSVPSRDVVEDETVDLVATALTWMLTTSNRFLRDRATKALVNLLSGRGLAVVRLVERFGNVDDPYVAERLYAVAYGAVMRSRDLAQVGPIAQSVYERVFRAGSPPAHILLRDYARGVVEYALHLGAPIDVDPVRIRPPYASAWPTIPTAEEIESLKPDWGRGGYDSGDLEWARNRIGSSVLHDDFAHYVIGTNAWLTSWLSIPLHEPEWQSPDERLAALRAGFGDEENAAWEQYELAEGALELLEALRSTGPLEGGAPDIVDQDAGDRAVLEQSRDRARARLLTIVDPQDRAELQAALAAKWSKPENRQPPGFDLRLVQRYILWRVFNLGWTGERFGYFDRYEVRGGGREASKAERMGKKYQWIAYHEILAFVADRFQYREPFAVEGDRAYDGPWQESLRDTDPSCTLRATPGGTSRGAHAAAWWAPAVYADWPTPAGQEAWVKRTADLPLLEALLAPTNAADGSRWLNLSGFLSWQQPGPLDRDPYSVPRGEVWYILEGYLVRDCDAERFADWAETVDFWGRWMPQPPTRYEVFLGEQYWSPAAKYFERPYYGGRGWSRPERGCPVSVLTASCEYLKEATGFDCSVDASYRLRLPSSHLARAAQLRWGGYGGEVVDAEDRLFALDPTASNAGPSALLVPAARLLRFLEREKLSLCWVVVGEKRVLGGDHERTCRSALRLSGAYVMAANGPTGFVNCTHDTGEGDGAARFDPFRVTLRTSR